MRSVSLRFVKLSAFSARSRIRRMRSVENPSSMTGPHNFTKAKSSGETVSAMLVFEVVHKAARLPAARVRCVRFRAYS
jgi:hypothetical protein